MDIFADNIYAIFNLIEEKKDDESLVNIKVISKQYLTYYLYRIFVKFINFFENALSTSDIKKLLEYFNIPKEHDMKNPYPIAGKIPIDEELLNVIILTFIDIFQKTVTYINSLTSDAIPRNIIEFFKQKDMKTILKDLFDLQKLLPGISISSINQ